MLLYLKSLQEVIRIFELEINQKIEMKLKEPIVLEDSKYRTVLGVNLFSRDIEEFRGVMVYISGQDGFMHACVYQGNHPYLKESDSDFFNEPRKLLRLSLERFGGDYKRGDRNQIPFLGIKPVVEESDPVLFLEVEKYLKREELNCGK
jgi:hypothetical protein